MERSIGRQMVDKGVWRPAVASCLSAPASEPVSAAFCNDVPAVVDKFRLVTRPRGRRCGPQTGRRDGGLAPSGPLDATPTNGLANVMRSGSARASGRDRPGCRSTRRSSRVRSRQHFCPCPPCLRCLRDMSTGGLSERVPRSSVARSDKRASHRDGSRRGRRARSFGAARCAPKGRQQTGR